MGVEMQDFAVPVQENNLGASVLQVKGPTLSLKSARQRWAAWGFSLAP
jgi:hypothetical protein